MSPKLRTELARIHEGNYKHGLWSHFVMEREFV